MLILARHGSTALNEAGRPPGRAGRELSDAASSIPLAELEPLVADVMRVRAALGGR
jgi:hypothetical protein